MVYCAYAYHYVLQNNIMNLWGIGRYQHLI
jgi:hypothetical protein